MVDQRLKSPSEVFTGEGVWAHIHQGDIYRIELRVDKPFGRFGSVLLYFPRQEGLFKIIKVIAGCVIARDVEKTGEFRDRGFCGRDIENVIRELPQLLGVADSMTLAYVTGNDRFNKRR